MDLKNGFMIYKYIKDLDWIGESKKGSWFKVGSGYTMSRFK